MSAIRNQLFPPVTSPVEARRELFVFIEQMKRIEQLPEAAIQWLSKALYDDGHNLAQLPLVELLHYVADARLQVTA